MLDWLSNLPVVWIAIVVLAATGLLTVAIYACVNRLARGDRVGAFAAVSPAMLPPMGILFGLIVGFLAVGVWDNVGRAQEALASETSALRSVVILSDDLPADIGDRVRATIRRQIDTAISEEWPAMQEQRASLSVIPALSDTLKLALGFKPENDGQVIVQREIVTSIEDALDARRQRIIVSESNINAVKWASLIALAALMLIAIAVVHSGNRTGSRIAMAVFATAVAVVITMLVAQDQPFSGQLGLDPDVLEQVLPKPSQS